MLIKPIEAKNQNSVCFSVWRNKGFKILIFSIINKNILDRMLNHMLTHFMVVYRKFIYNKLKLLFIITMNAPRPHPHFRSFHSTATLYVYLGIELCIDNHSMIFTIMAHFSRDICWSRRYHNASSYYSIELIRSLKNSFV